MISQTSRYFTLYALLSTCIMLSSEEVFAWECKFSKPLTHQLQINTPATSVKLLSAGQRGVIYEARTNQSATLSCINGGNGVGNLYGTSSASANPVNLNYTYSDVGTNYTLPGFPTFSPFMVAFYPTNIKGIYYAIKLITTKKMLFETFLPLGNEMPIYKTYIPHYEDVLDGELAVFAIMLYQNSDFSGTGGQSKITPAKSGTLGRFRFSTNTGYDNTLNISSGSFSIPLDLPSCTAQIDSLGSNLGDTNIDLGSVTSQQISEGKAPNKKMYIVFTNCNVAVSTATIKFSSTSVSQNGQWLKDTNGKTGAAVRISHWNNNGKLWPPGVAYTHTLPRSLEFGAQLVQDGAVQSGDFKANATFQIDYN